VLFPDLPRVWGRDTKTRPAELALGGAEWEFCFNKGPTKEEAGGNARPGEGRTKGKPRKGSAAAGMVPETAGGDLMPEYGGVRVERAVCDR